MFLSRLDLLYLLDKGCFKKARFPIFVAQKRFLRRLNLLYLLDKIVCFIRPDLLYLLDKRGF